MYEVSCRDLGVADCEFHLIAHSLERLELDILAHARYCHPRASGLADTPSDSSGRRRLRERIVAAARPVESETLLV